MFGGFIASRSGVDLQNAPTSAGRPDRMCIQDRRGIGVQKTTLRAA